MGSQATIKWHDSLQAEIAGIKILDTSRSRLWVVMIIFGIVFAALAFRLFSITFFTDEVSTASGKAHPSGYEFNRKEIVDRNGEIIAINLATASLYADATVVLDAKESAKKLHQLLPDVSYDSILSKITSGKHFVWIKRNLTPKEQYAINALGIPGLYFKREEKRIYPQGNLFSHVLGYVGLDGKGLSGTEKTFDQLLGDVDGKNLDPLKLSLDVRVQGVLHEELSRYMQEFKASGAAGVVMDVSNGEVVAMVSLPDFDPHDPGKVQDNAKFNRLTLGVYEMGSTFKTFNTAMALDAGVVSLRSGYDASKPIHVGRFTISDFHGKNRWLSVPEIFMYSSNIGSAKMAVDVGSEVQQYFMKELGMLDVSPIELPEVGKPLYPHQWKEVSTMTISYGHGIAVTPMHAVTGMAAMVNGGIKYPPTILRHKSGEKATGVSIISAKTSSEMRQLLRLVVQSGTGSKADAKGFMVGGKTGTSEKNQKGKYNKKALLSSFIGAFPMYNPRYVVFAMLDDPVGNRSTGWYATGGQVAAPIVKNVVTRIGPLLDIMPVNTDDEAMRRAFWTDFAQEGKEFESY